MTPIESNATNILLVDDHSLVASGLAANLEALGFSVAVAMSISEAKECMRRHRFDLGLFDITLPDGSGIDLMGPDVEPTDNPSRILFLSGLHDPDEILMALDGRRAAFVSKTAPFDDLVKAISFVLSDVSDGPLLWRTETKSFIPLTQAFPRGIALSPKEREVFQRMRDGLSDKQIAHELGRSIHTIRVQIRSILRKRKTRRREEVF